MKLHTLFIASIAFLSIAQTSIAEESAAFVARTEALQQKSLSSTQTQTIADSSSAGKSRKDKEC
jgi:hypothetical protein